MKKIFLIMGVSLFGCSLHAHIDLNNNNNSFSDVYELIYFGGSAAPFADPDGDRVTTYDEMFWGTNPTTYESTTRIQKEP